MKASRMKLGGVVEARRILQTSGIKGLFDVVAAVEAEDAAEGRRVVAEQIPPIHGCAGPTSPSDLIGCAAIRVRETSGRTPA